MSVAAVLVTLAAAAVHALWNQLLAHSDDIHLRTAVGMLIGAVAFLPVALLDPRSEPWAGCSPPPTPARRSASSSLLVLAAFANEPVTRRQVGGAVTVCAGVAGIVLG